MFAHDIECKILIFEFTPFIFADRTLLLSCYCFTMQRGRFASKLSSYSIVAQKSGALIHIFNHGVWSHGPSSNLSTTTVDVLVDNKIIGITGVKMFGNKTIGVKGVTNCGNKNNCLCKGFAAA